MLSKKPKNVILVGSGKGGVGKTFLACMTALALARKHPEELVALLDLDVEGPNVLSMIGIERLSRFIQEPLLECKTVDGSLKWLPFVQQNHDNLEVFSIKPYLDFALSGNGSALDRGKVWRELDIRQAVEHLFGSRGSAVAWSRPPVYYVMDTPPGVGVVMKSVLDSARARMLPKLRMMVVSTPKKPSIDKCRPFLGTLASVREIEVVGVVANMVIEAGRPAAPVRKMAEDYGHKFLGSIPETLEIERALDRGEIPMDYAGVVDVVL